MTLILRPILLIYLMLHFLYSYSQKNEIISESDSVRARKLELALNRKGAVLANAGLYLQALDTFNVSLQLRIKNYGEVHYNLGAAYLGIGIIYNNLGQYDLALDYFKLAEQNYQTDKVKFNNRTKSHLYANFGNAYRGKLDYNMALQYYNQNLSLYENNADNKEIITGINYRIAEIYYSINDINKALQIINGNIKNAHDEHKKHYYELLSFINHVTGNFIEARKNYQKALNLTIYLSNDATADINVARQYLNYSLFLIRIDDYKEASQNLEKAYEIIKRTEPERGQVLAAYYNLKGYFIRFIPIEEKNIESFSILKNQNLQKAINWYSMALRALDFPKNYSQADIEDSDNWLSIVDCIDFLKKIADTNNEIALNIRNLSPESNIEYILKAIENYQFAASLIQKARKELTNDDSKIQLTELENTTFQELIATAFNAYSITEDSRFIEIAFQNAERIKGSSIFDKLSNESAMENSLIPDSLIQTENKLKNSITFYKEKLFEERNSTKPDSALIADYNQIILQTNQSREELLQNLEENYNDYYELKYSENMLSVSEIQQELSDDNVILEYVLNETDTDSKLYTFLISNADVKFSQQNVNRDFIKAIESMFHFMSNRDYIYTTNEDARNFCISSRRLFETLIAPYLGEIQNKNLTIVPDGKLNYIAFDALLEELPDTSNLIRFNQLKYLIKNFNINYSYSSNLLFKLKSADKKSRNKVTAFAPDYQGDSIEVANHKYVLLPLPGVKQEVNKISKIVNTQAFNGNMASETNFRKNIKDTDILHLAMHAFINDSLPSFSWLAFDQDTSTSLTSDGRINTIDIYNLDLNARLTVLSACNTGGGQLKKGEGIMSLARGFFYAGCPSIIMSLWEVEDQSGSQIMSSFYKYLKKGKTKDEALRLSKLEYLENSNSRRAHPHYWSGYISLGNNSALYKSYDFYFFIFLIVLVIGIFTDQVNRIKKARKKRAF